MKDAILYLKKKKIPFELFYFNANETSNELFNDKVSFTSSGESSSLGVRVALGKKLGFSYTDNINDYRKCIEAAISSAKSNQPDNDFPGFNNENVKGKMRPSREILNLDSEWLYKASKSIVDDVKSINNNVIVSEGGLSKSIAKVRIVTSEGLDAEESYGTVSASLGLTLKKNGQMESVGVSKSSIGKINLNNIAKEGNDRLTSLFGRASIKSGSYQLLLHPEALASLLSESYSFSIDAENVHQKKSIFANKIGNKVFSGNVSITDDGVTPSLLGSRSFDSEGSRTGIHKIIENGILKQFIYDRKYASLENKKSTGNASRSSSSLPSIATNNVIMKPGKSKDVFRECDNAIYVRGLLGVHTMNESTGDFSLGVQEGHLIRNGKIICPLKGVIIAGNFFSIMNDVKALSKNIEDIPNHGCSYILPYALFGSINATC